MFKIDGKELDLTKPETLHGITFKEGGYIEQLNNGLVVKVEQAQPQLPKEEPKE
jgi:hypothetical protein